MIFIGHQWLKINIVILFIISSNFLFSQEVLDRVNFLNNKELKKISNKLITYYESDQTKVYIEINSMGENNEESSKNMEECFNLLNKNDTSKIVLVYIDEKSHSLYIRYNKQCDYFITSDDCEMIIIKVVPLMKKKKYYKALNKIILDIKNYEKRGSLITE